MTRAQAGKLALTCVYFVPNAFVYGPHGARMQRLCSTTSPRPYCGLMRDCSFFFITDVEFSLHLTILQLAYMCSLCITLSRPVILMVTLFIGKSTVSNNSAPQRTKFFSVPGTSAWMKCQSPSMQQPWFPQLRTPYCLVLPSRYAGGSVRLHGGLEPRKGTLEPTMRGKLRIRHEPPAFHCPTPTLCARGCGRDHAVKGR